VAWYFGNFSTRSIAIACPVLFSVLNMLEKAGLQYEGTLRNNAVKKWESH
jgi:hypothetical protein